MTVPFNRYILAEIIIVFSTIFYAFLWDRDTLSDLIIFSFFTVLLYFGAAKVGLTSPKKKAWSTLEKKLIITSIWLIGIAWFYGFCTQKTSLENCIIALNISFVYVYYAFVQHFLAQKYLSLRLYSLMQKWGLEGLKVHAIVYTALVSAFLFAALHINYPHLIVVAAIAGFLYAYYFLSTGRLYTIVISHAFVASSHLYWLLDDNPFTELMWILDYFK